MASVHVISDGMGMMPLSVIPVVVLDHSTKDNLETINQMSCFSYATSHL